MHLISHFFSQRENPDRGLPGFETWASSSLMLFACSPKEVALVPWPSLYYTAWKIRVPVPVVTITILSRRSLTKQALLGVRGGCEMLFSEQGTAISITNNNFSCVQHQTGPGHGQSWLREECTHLMVTPASSSDTHGHRVNPPPPVNSLGHKTKQNDINAVKNGGGECCR